MRALSVEVSFKQKLILDALRYSLELESKCYSSLTRALKKIEILDDGLNPSSAITLRALANAWGIIDVTYRIRGLVCQISGMSQKLPELQLFLRSTAIIERFRHLYQHLNTEIPKIQFSTQPIMGVLSWITQDPYHSKTIFLGTGDNNIQAHGLAFDNLNMCFAQKLLFSAGNQDVELDKIHLQIRAFSKYLNLWLKNQNKLSDDNLLPSIMRFGVEFRDH